VAEQNVALLVGRVEDKGLLPTRVNILSKILDILGSPRASKLTRVYLFLSGHGVVSSRDGQLYFVCQDTLPVLLEETAVSIDVLINSLRLGGPSEIVVLLDTCRSIFIKGAKATTGADY
jgi:uncharacterized caspase-like protein